MKFPILLILAVCAVIGLVASPSFAGEYLYSVHSVQKSPTQKDSVQKTVEVQTVINPFVYTIIYDDVGQRTYQTAVGQQLVLRKRLGWRVQASRIRRLNRVVSVGVCVGVCR